MCEAHRSNLSDIWSSVYLPIINQQIALSNENKDKYSAIAETSFTRALAGILTAYIIDKIYIRPNGDFDDKKEVELMLDLVFNGINGMKQLSENYQ